MDEQVLSAERRRPRTEGTQKDRVIQNGGQMPRKAPMMVPRRRPGKKAKALPDPVSLGAIEGRGTFETFESYEFYGHLGPEFAVAYTMCSSIFSHGGAITSWPLYELLIKSLRTVSEADPLKAPGLFIPRPRWVDQFTQLAAAWCRTSPAKRKRLYAPSDILQQAIRICHRAVPRFTVNVEPTFVQLAVDSLKSGGAKRLLIADAGHVDLRLIGAFTPRIRKFMKQVGEKPTRPVTWKPLKSLDDFVVMYRVEMESGGSIERFADAEAAARKTGRAGSGPGRAAKIRRLAREAIKQAHAFMKA